VDLSDRSNSRDVNEHKIAHVIQKRDVNDPGRLGQKKYVESLDLSREIITNYPANFDSFLREKQHGVSKERSILSLTIRFVLR
jgi:hypothetical protein